ncbi:MAG: hypothetical protein KDI03_06930, partial [Anaerolineae bacterium]|nr:hypothetical protein [Anaerolineae bacterium]
NGNCIGCLLTTFAVNVDNQALEPGDIVAPAGMQAATFDTGSTLLQVRKAGPGDAVVGVVSGRAEVFMDDEPQPDETGERLVPRDGAAQPGDYVAVVYSGPMQVRVAPNEAAISAGVRVTAASDGTVRPLSTKSVLLANGEGTLDVMETVPVAGIALAPAQDGSVWILVNPQ